MAESGFFGIKGLQMQGRNFGKTGGEIGNQNIYSVILKNVNKP